MAPPKNSNNVPKASRSGRPKRQCASPKASTSGRAKRQCASVNAAAYSPKRLRYDPASKSAENRDRGFCQSVGLSKLRF